MNPFTIFGIIFLVVGIAVFIASAVYGISTLKKVKARSAEAENEKKRILDEAQKAAETEKKEALIEAKEEILKMIDNGEFIDYHKSKIELMFFMRDHGGTHRSDKN